MYYTLTLSIQAHEGYAALSKLVSENRKAPVWQSAHEWQSGGEKGHSDATLRVGKAITFTDMLRSAAVQKDEEGRELSTDAEKDALVRIANVIDALGGKGKSGCYSVNVHSSIARSNGVIVHQEGEAEYKLLGNYGPVTAGGQRMLRRQGYSAASVVELLGTGADILSAMARRTDMDSAIGDGLMDLSREYAATVLSENAATYVSEIFAAQVTRGR